MSAIELLRSQKNQVFNEIKRVGIEPSEFEWQEVDSHWGGVAPAIHHRSTQYYFIFDSVNENWHLRFYPSPLKAVEGKRTSLENWGDVISTFSKWISFVRLEVNEPDLWSFSQEEKQLIAEQIDDIDNNQFSPEEKLRISRAIEELHKFLLMQNTFTDKQLLFISTRLKHLEDASNRLGRKDWITLTMGTLINIIVGVALNPESARELVRITGSLLGWIVGTAHLLP